jgi:hypothetical protein
MLNHTLFTKILKSHKTELAVLEFYAYRKRDIVYNTGTNYGVLCHVPTINRILKYTISTFKANAIFHKHKRPPLHHCPP